ncbi:MAG: hypothetical protein FJ123_00770 [Deltaproteobacteria bacterium]|nr:hypothetical protein [Deltaproteobacteria bacterium]
MGGKEIVLCLMFGSLGFFMAFFLLRTVNIALLLLLTWIPFKVMENYGLIPDWQLFHSVKDISISLIGALIDLLLNLVKMAPIASMILFLAGGITGIVLNMKSKKK